MENIINKKLKESIIGGLLLAILFLFLANNTNALESHNIGPHPRLFLTSERWNEISVKASTNAGEIYAYFIETLNDNISTVPYGEYEFAIAYALAYKITGNTIYRDKAISLIYTELDIFNPENIWYQNRNAFRGNNIYYCLFFDWMYDDLSSEQKAMALTAFKIWGDYWIDYVDYNNTIPFTNFVEQDSDETTSLTENFLLLGLVLHGEPEYDIYADLLITISDTMLDTFVLDLYMDNYMKGGVWAEGVEYNAGTCQHWIRQFMLNREIRSIPYPNNYGDLNMLAHIHSTLPAYTSMFIFGDIEDMHDDYTTPTEEYDRWEHVITLIDMIDDPDLKSMGQNWLNTVKTKYSGTLPWEVISIYTGVWRMLFEHPDAVAKSPAELLLPTGFVSEGINFIAMRDNWSDNANAISFQNSMWHVDHMQHDALSFNIYRNGKVVTRECSGYGGISDETFSHNSLLIENKDNWGSNVSYRALGQGSYPVTVFNDEFNYIEAEAAPVYNYQGWHGITYTENVNRKFLWIKPGIVLVYDYVKLVDDGIKPWPGSSEDSNTFDGHKRRVRYVQHFQNEPILSNGNYSAQSEGQKLFVKTLFPENSNTVVIDEKIDPRFSAPEYQMLENQKKWHIEVETADTSNTTRLLHMLYFDDDSIVTMPDTQLLNIPGEMLGAHVKSPEENYLVLFGSQTPGTDVENIEYSLTNSILTKHILVDMLPDTRYQIKINGISISKTSDAKGILSFIDSVTGVRNYSISAIQNNPDMNPIYLLLMD